ncbi:MAG TPA: putative glycolipid-binding domain-containing protein [Methanoregulaceae archaeon]|nr:putative glycolipid-binding domain-containing protein [Methanoregulaceae archaeon]HPD76140.1 putative glycolipid-binding domain-containing protein [Methanoregulaceae archaeon]
MLWYNPEMPSMERCSFTCDRKRPRFQGTVLTTADGAPAEVRYVVTCNSGWQTRHCVVTMTARESREMVRLSVDREGLWFQDGKRRPDLDGVADIDLAFSPCTNTLPIRRIDLSYGQQVRIPVAWLRFPELDLVRTDQVYEQLSERRYRFSSADGGFSAVIETDRQGMVVRYGDLWRTVPDDAIP